MPPTLDERNAIMAASRKTRGTLCKDREASKKQRRHDRWLAKQRKYFRRLARQQAR
jgi:hypothetical protein